MELQDAGANEAREKSTEERIFSFPFWKPCRRKHPPDSAFFASGNLERELLAKQVILEITDEEKHQISSLEEDQRWKMKCPVVGCKAKLNGLTELETHFFSRHTAVCSVCSCVFPTSRLLDLHIAETHDSFFQAKVEHGHPMYKCLVDGCEAKFLNDTSRHQHLVDKHKFPRTFEFHKKRHLSQKQRYRLRKSQQGGVKRVDGKQHKQEVACESGQDFCDTGMEVDALTSAVSRLSTTDHMPSKVSFGRRHNRAFAFANPRGRERERYGSTS